MTYPRHIQQDDQHTARPGPSPLTCQRCTGTGTYMSFSGRPLGSCFTCHGTGIIIPPPAPRHLDADALAPIISAFALATAKLKRPRLNLGDFRITLAKPDSRNPGALYVKRSGCYLGKITAATFLQSRECDNDTALEVTRICRDPMAYAIAHGRETGSCAICSRTLSDPDSIARGIGPICARTFGWDAQ